MSSIRRQVAPALVAGVTVVCAGATALLVAAAGRHVSTLVTGNEASTWQAGLVFGLLAAAIMRDNPANRLGPVIAWFAALASIAAFAEAYAPYAHRHGLALAAPAAWVASVFWLPAFVGLVVVIPLLFPDGRLRSGRWRWPARLGLGCLVFATLGYITTQESLTSSGYGYVRNPIDLPFPDHSQLAVALVALAAGVLVGLAGAIDVLLRIRRVSAADRPRYAWFATAILLGLCTLLPVPDAVHALLNVLSFIALGVGVMRHRLFDVESLLPRTLVWMLLVGASLAVYVASAAVLGTTIGGHVLPALVTAVVALLIARMHGRVQRLVSSLLYGQRDDPTRALTILGDRLAASLGTDDVLPTSVESVRRTLRIPYAAIGLAGETGLACGSGAPVPRTVDLPLVHADEQVGVLRLGLRTGERVLSRPDAALLRRFTPHLAAAAQDIRTSRELRRSREQLASLRERERARIHRDLHDGLGPALAGISLGLETAGRLAGRDGAAAAQLLCQLNDDARACVDEVRRIVADLRPTQLGAGLSGALKQRAELLAASSGDLSIEVDVGPIDGLPEPLETAVYRIATEAMTNAARHSGARRITVTLTFTDTLRLVVEDDGHGREPTAVGTGLASMDQRATELGGSCVVRFRAGEGTRVEAVLPRPEVIA